MAQTKHKKKADALRRRVRSLYDGGMPAADVAREVGYTYAHIYKIIWPEGKPPELKRKRNGKKPLSPSEMGKKGAAVTNSAPPAQRSQRASKAANAKWAKARAAKAQEGAQ